MVGLTVKLNSLSRSAFPVAVRQTLNDAAFDVKQKTLDTSATKNFIRRSPNFFKRFSGVNKATGFSVSAMRAEVGMTAMGQSTAQTAIDHMNQQEGGGGIKGGIDYLKGSRGGSNLRKVAKSNYLKKSNVLTGPYRRKGTAKSNFIASAYAALKTGKLMKFKAASGKIFFSQVTNMSTVAKGRNKGKMTIKSKLVIQERGGITVKATHFSREAAMMTYAKLPSFYQAQAEKQFTKMLK